jgi:hypothetical protein
VCALALLAGGTAYMLHDGTADDEDAPPSTQHSASGAIDAKSGGRTPGGALPAAPAVAAAIERRPAVDERPMSIGDTVVAARRAMEQHDLTAARSRLKSIAPAQQSRPDVQRLKDDLAQRELERDAALQLARACEKTSAWACVQQNAGEALALDGSNTESQAMLERVITHAGWLAGTPPLAAKKRAAQDGAGAVPPAATAAATAAAPATAAQQPATPPARVAAVKPSPAPAPAAATVQTQTQTPPPAAPKPAAVATRAPASPPAETHSTATETHATTPPPARESRRSPSYARSAPSSSQSMSDVTVIPAPAISPPLLPTASTAPVARGTAQAAAAPSVPHATASTATTAPAATESATSPTTAMTTHSATPATSTATTTPRSTPPATTTATPLPATPSYAAAPAAPAARVVTAIPATTAAVAPTSTTTTNTTNTTNTTTTTAPAPAQIPATPTRTAAVTGSAAGTASAMETRPAPRAPLPDSENADELERAIKQFGWSGGDSMPKQTR